MDVVVTVPKTFRWLGSNQVGLLAWIDEGDAAGDPPMGCLWRFSTSGGRPNISPGERVYVVCEGMIRGYAPLVELRSSANRVDFMRGGGAVAVTIPERVIGFRGWRYRWWDSAIEVPFPDWKNPTAKLPATAVTSK